MRIIEEFLYIYCTVPIQLPNDVDDANRIGLKRYFVNDSQCTDAMLGQG